MFDQQQHLPRDQKLHLQPRYHQEIIIEHYNDFAIQQIKVLIGVTAMPKISNGGNSTLKHIRMKRNSRSSLLISKSMGLQQAEMNFVLIASTLKIIISRQFSALIM